MKDEGKFSKGKGISVIWIAGAIFVLAIGLLIFFLARENDKDPLNEEMDKDKSSKKERK